MIRRYSRDDIPYLVEKLREYHPRSGLGQLKFSEQKIKDLLVGNLNNIMFFCNLYEDEGEILGCICATISSPFQSHEAVAADHIFYCATRSTEASTALVESYLEWAKERRVKLVYIRQSSGIKPELFSKFVQKFGFSYVGSMHVKEI